MNSTLGFGSGDVMYKFFRLLAQSSLLLEAFGYVAVTAALGGMQLLPSVTHDPVSQLFGLFAPFSLLYRTCKQVLMPVRTPEQVYTLLKLLIAVGPG